MASRESMSSWNAQERPNVLKMQPRQSNHLDVTSRFLVFGLKEVKRYIQSRHIQSVLIAKNIQSSSRDHSGLEDQVQAIIDLAAEASVPIVFALTRRTLSRLIFGHDRAAISCIGVMKVDSLGELHQTLLECAWQHRIIWRSQFSQTRTPLLNSRNENPLWIAVYYNYRDPFLLQEILRAGYFLDEPDARNGETPLMLAIQKKRLHWVQDLLPHKPDFSLKSFLGRNVFWHACSSGSESIWGVICEAACQRHPASRVHEWIVQRDVCGTSALDISKAGSLADKVALVTSGLLPHDSTSP